MIRYVQITRRVEKTVTVPPSIEEDLWFLKVNKNIKARVKIEFVFVHRMFVRLFGSKT